MCRECVLPVMTRDHCVSLLACVMRGGLEVGERSLDCMWAIVKGIQSELELLVDNATMQSIIPPLVLLERLAT